MENIYNRGKIYKVWDSEYTKCYIGSTCQELSMRMAGHRSQYKKWLNQNNNGCVYISVFDLFHEFGVENCRIEWVEDCPCNSRKELEAREGHHQRENDCVNKCVAGRTKKEYIDEHRDDINAKKKTWNRENKEYVGIYNKEYYDKHRVEILLQNQEYRKNNIDMLRQKSREWKEKSKEYVREKDKVKITCVCGEVLLKKHIKRHEKSLKHQTLLNKQPSET